MLEGTFNKLNAILSGFQNSAFTRREINELVSEIHETFLGADVPYEYVEALTENLKAKLPTLRSKKIDKAAVVGGLIKSYLDNTFDYRTKGITLKDNDITAIAVYGTNGVGKTSFIAKLANLIQRDYGKSVMCLSFDKTRPAAQEQLRVLCANNKIEFVQLDDNSFKKNLERAANIVQYRLVDVLLVDTAGISPDNREGAVQLNKIMKTIRFDERLLVLDGTFGQYAIDLIRKFTELTKPTGFVITKTESDQKGGVFFSVRTASDKPIYYITYGEKINDITPFNQYTIGNALFSDGGLRRLIESFHASNQEEILAIINKSKNQALDYNDLKTQLTQLINFGKLDKVLSVLPHTRSFFNVKIGAETYNMIKKWIAIINAMTIYERKTPACLGIERMNRIANGSGTTIADVITLKKKLEEINLSLAS